MPGDSTHYLEKYRHEGLLNRNPNGDSIESFVSLQDTENPLVDTADDKSGLAGTWITLVAFAIIFGGRYLLQLGKQKYRVALAKGAYENNFKWYHQQLLTYNQYYASLPLQHQEKFLQRTVEFMFSKRFHYKEINPQDQMPLLISSAAIQITFGMEEYLLEHFRDIYVYKNDYRYGLYNLPFMGHVSASGIHLSWNNFMKGYENYADADNVGIHEMAHALVYVNFVVRNGEGSDILFKGGFPTFSTIARPIFNAMQKGATNLLSSYAATNYHEFWAVAVETFFEKSAEMKEQMPELYEALCKLLKQDPLVPEKLLV